MRSRLLAGPVLLAALGAGCAGLVGANFDNKRDCTGSNACAEIGCTPVTTSDALKLCNSQQNSVPDPYECPQDTDSESTSGCTLMVTSTGQPSFGDGTQNAWCCPSED
jgi:hypothetical protein